MIWPFLLSIGLLVAAALMAPLCKLFAPAWADAGASRSRRRATRSKGGSI